MWKEDIGSSDEENLKDEVDELKEEINEAKEEIKEFKKGIFLLTAPPGIYRCAASPYERACIIAAHFKKNKIPGKFGQKKSYGTGG